MIQINPYTPGAGLMPRCLAGRDEVLEKADETLARVAACFTARSSTMGCAAWARPCC
ncbi:MAG: hypothetical protein LUG14_04895 [Synergistaceae bacterium]|nr:hypothetical protein [Synergistaceae bacterium]